MSRFTAMPAGWLDHPMFQSVTREPYDHRSAWAWLIDRAAFQARAVEHGGKRYELERGQLAISLPDLASAWGWNTRKVARFITVARGRGMIVTVTGMRTTIITVCFYDEYQRGDDPTVMVVDERVTRHRPTTVMDSRAVSLALTNNTNIPKKDSPDGESLLNGPTNGQMNGQANGHASATGEPLILTPSDDGPKEVAELMLAIWLQNCGHFHMARGLEKDRITKLNARWRDSFEKREDQWREFCGRVRDSPLLSGGKGNWHATLDWVLEPKNLRKVQEGNYDERQTGGLFEPTSTYLGGNRASGSGVVAAIHRARLARARD